MPEHSEQTLRSHRREIDRDIETIRLTLRGRWAVESARQDSLMALKALRDEIERLRTLITQAAAEANGGELTDGTLASLTEVSEDG